MERENFLGFIFTVYRELEREITLVTVTQKEWKDQINFSYYYIDMNSDVTTQQKPG